MSVIAPINVNSMEANTLNDEIFAVKEESSKRAVVTLSNRYQCVLEMDFYFAIS
jgi:hypothetical protein